MDMRDIRIIEFLENNKLLLDGLRLQHKRVALESGEENTSLEIIRDFINAQWTGAKTTDHQNRTTYRRQDPFLDFYLFIDAEAKHRVELMKEYENQGRLTTKDLGRTPTDQDAIICWNTDMLWFYTLTERIRRIKQANSKLAYLYEDLCNSLARLQGSEMCYILQIHQTGIHVLSHSSIPLNTGENPPIPIEILTDEEFRHVPQILEQVKTDEVLVAETVYRMELRKRQTPNELVLRSEGENGRSIFPVYICFPIVVVRMLTPPDQVSGDQEELCLIFQYQSRSLCPELEGVETPDKPFDWISPNPKPVTPFDLWKARNILVLRQRILEIALRDRFALLTMRREYRCVIPLSKEKRAEHDKESGNALRILHLTDLHIQKSNHKAILELLRKFPSSGLSGDTRSIDLMLITGDVVQGWNNAGELETNYKCAVDIIRRLACVLWGQNSKLRADWQRRIVIIPGNHDYASMNEMEVVSENGSRATGMGRPSKKEGGPMVKFAYYEEFLNELLGIDIGQMNRSGLNEYREYTEMALQVIGLNTSVDAGPLRNNKVSIFAPFVESLKALQRPDKEMQVLWLGHHTVRYRPNYSVDRYYSWKIKDEARMERLVKKFRDIIVRSDINKLSVMTKEERYKLQKDIDDLYKDLDGNKDLDGTPLPLVPEKDPFMADVLFYKQNWHIAKNEQCNSIRHAVLQEAQMELADLLFCREQYEKMKEICKPYKPTLMLGGHIHEIRVGNCCYEGDKFFARDEKKQGQLNYAILELSGDFEHGSHSWRSCQLKKDRASRITELDKFIDDCPNGLDVEYFFKDLDS